MSFLILVICVICVVFVTSIVAELVQRALCKKLGIAIHPTTCQLMPDSSPDKVSLYLLIYKVYEWQLLASWLTGAAIWLSLPDDWWSVVVVVPGAACAGLVIAPASLFLAKYSFRTFVRMCSIPPPKNSSVR